jgi:hypothetical protein
MFKLARKNYLREIFSGGSGCTGDCGQGRRCTCFGESKEMSRPPETAEKPTDGEAQNPASCINRSDIIPQETIPNGKNPQESLLIAKHNYRTGKL